MIVPSTRIFTAGEVETGAYLNSAVTNMGNFMLGKPVAQLTSTATTAVTLTTATPIPFSVANLNRDNSWSSATNPSRYTAQTAGWYFVQAEIHWAALAGTYRACYLRKNAAATGVAGSLHQILGSATASQTTHCASLVYLNGTTDYVELIGVSGTTTALAASSIVGAPTTTANMNVVWVSL